MLAVPKGFVRRFRTTLWWMMAYGVLGTIIGSWRLQRTHGGSSTGTLELVLVAAAWYVWLAVSVSLIVGGFGGWATTRWRGAVVGIVATVPGALAINYLLRSLSPLKLVVYLALIGLLVGAPMGAMYWRRDEG